MRVGELSVILDEVARLLASGGGASAARDLEKLRALLEQHSDRDLGDYLSEIEHKLDPVSRAAVHIARLKEAELDERRFEVALERMRADDAISKDAAIAVAKGYGVIRLTTRSRSTVIESIDKHFHWMLYNRDADALAKRATPW